MNRVSYGSFTKSLLTLFALLIAALWFQFGHSNVAYAAATGTISGIVTDANGNPLSGANVYTYNAGQTTDAHGAYTLNVPPGTYTVYADKPGYTKYARDNVQVTAGNTSTVNFSFGAISGNVTDASGHPVSGVTVYTNNTAQETNASGAYTLNVPAGTYTVTIAPKSAYGTYSRNEIQVAEGNVAAVHFSYGAINVTVNDGRGHPVSGATVSTSYIAQTTNADGTATLHVAPGTHNITVYKPGYAAYTQYNIQVTAGNTTTATFSYGAISGTVTNVSGNPVSGANVHAYGSEQTTTDASGKYTLNVPAGTYANVQVSGIANGYALYYQNNILVTAGQTTTLNFSYGAISGIVNDANGNPVSGATIGVSGLNRSTNADGSYTLNVPAGTYSVYVSKAGYPNDRKDNIQVTAGQTTTVNFGNFSLGVISGTVTGAGGIPVSGATVSAYGTSGAFSASTDASGNYALNVSAGTYSVTVTKTDYASYSKNNIQVTAGNAVTVNFSYGAINGTVTDASGNPVSGAAVSISGFSQTTNADGGYTLNVPAGTYTVYVSKAGYPSAHKDNIQVTAGQTTTVNFGAIRSTAPLPDNITVINNAAGNPDTITVKGLAAGDVIKVYNMETGGNLLAASNPVISGQSSVTASVYQLGTAAGQVFVSVTSTGKTESTRTMATYGAEPVDTTAPVTKYRLDPVYAQTSTGKQYIKGFTVSLQATDNQSGVKVIKYRVNGGAWTTYSAPFTIFAGTTHTVDYFSTDHAGNAENPVNKMDFDKGTFTGAGSF